MTTEPPEIDLDRADADHKIEHIRLAFDNNWNVPRANVRTLLQRYDSALTWIDSLRQQVANLQQEARQADMDCDNAITQACRQELNDAADHVETFWGIKLIAVELRVRAAQVGQQAAPETPIADEFTLGRWWQVRLDSDNSLWCETSDGEEARQAMSTAPSACTLRRLYQTEPRKEWRVQP